MSSIRAGSYEHIGERPEMQDAHFLHVNGIRPGIFGVFDGHGPMGRTVAQLTRSEMYERFKLFTPPLEVESYQSASEKIFEDCDVMMGPIRGGTTATVVDVHFESERRLIDISAAGDSPALLIDPENPEDESGVIWPIMPHDTTNATEVARLEREKVLRGEGRYSHLFFYEEPLHYELWRFAISRSIGDMALKGVLPTPDVARYTGSEHRLLLLGTDGVIRDDTWEDVVMDVAKGYRAIQADSSKITNDLLSRLAKDTVLKFSEKTRDNATLIIADLPAAATSDSTKNGVLSRVRRLLA